MNTHHKPERSVKQRLPIALAVTALAIAVSGSTPVGHAGALPGGTSGALASDNRGEYASPELLQLGFGPGGPPAASGTPVKEAASVGTGRDYASAEIIQLGYGPGGPPASGRS